MLAVQFRATTERVTAFRELLKNPIFLEAIVVLKDERPSAAVDQGADAIESVRVAAKVEQHEHAINLLLSLAEPMPVVPESEEEPGFGVDRSQFPQQT